MILFVGALAKGTTKAVVGGDKRRKKRTNWLIQRDIIPDGWYCYDLRGTHKSPSTRTTLVDHAADYHAGTVLSPIPLKHEGTASRRVNGTFYLLGEEMTLEQFCEEHDLAYPQDNREFVLRPASLDEVGLFYSEEKLDEALGTVGHLRMDFGHGEKEFWHTWWPHNEDRFNTPEFKEVLQRFVDDLRQTGLLKNLGAMDAYCWQHGGSITEDRRSYGYIAETENYRFCLRCTPFPGEYQGYLYGQLTTYTFHAILNASLSNCRSGIFKPFPKSSGGAYLMVRESA